MLDFIREESERINDMLTNFLDFAKPKAPSFRETDLREVLEKTVELISGAAQEQKVEIVLQHPEGKIPLYADPEQIREALVNLELNALEAMPEGGSLRISLAQNQGDGVIIQIRDTGVGIPPGAESKIFDPFFTTKEVGKGTGLGLATVYGIVKQNNGFIDVQSEPGRGTAFRIYLPITDVPISEEQRFQGQNQNLKGTETVLVVEDEEPILDLGKRILEHHGYLVLAARHPAEALNLAKSYPGRIDLLITDVIMPGMNGKELTEKLTIFKTGFKSIFMSGYSNDIIARHGILDAGVHFLQKPFSVQSLAEKVREVLDG
jgi:CheY-like chemotaxis protein